MVECSHNSFIKVRRNQEFVGVVLHLFTALFHNYCLNVMSADAEGSQVLYQILHAFNI